MSTNLLKDTKITRVEASATAGQTTLTTDTLDMKEFDGCTFIAALGDVTDTAVVTLTIQTGDASDGSDAADTGIIATFTAGASDADSKLLVAEIVRPLKRYVTATLDRGTANAVVDGIFAIQTDPTRKPTTQSSDVIASDFGLGD